MKLPVVDETIKDKRVLVRGDIDVPLKDGQIQDDTRLKDIKPTIDFLLQNGCQVTLCGHLGRPEGVIKPELSSKPIQEYFPAVRVLENLRFDIREEKNDGSLAKELTQDKDIFVNESFAESYREVASITGVAKLLPHYAGFRLAKEVEVLSKVLEDPERPLLVIIGGAKIDTKQPLIDKMQDLADFVVVGGKLATQEKDFLIDSLPQAKTIVWNGPMGAVEAGYTAGTQKLIDLILAQKDAYKIVGGGDTVAFLDKLGLTDKFNWVSSGGGSMLKFLSGEKLPGIEALLL
jgi:phosphoglycerate kinase